MSSDQARISQLENGQLNPTWLTVQRICAVLGVKVSDLALRVEELEDTAK